MVSTIRDSSFFSRNLPCPADVAPVSHRLPSLEYIVLVFPSLCASSFGSPVTAIQRSFLVWVFCEPYCYLTCFCLFVCVCIWVQTCGSVLTQTQSYFSFCSVEFRLRTSWYGGEEFICLDKLLAMWWHAGLVVPASKLYCMWIFFGDRRTNTDNHRL